MHKAPFPACHVVSSPPPPFSLPPCDGRPPDFANCDTGRVVVAHHASYDASHINDDDNTSHVDKDDKDDM